MITKLANNFKRSLSHDDRGANLATENINRLIKLVARTITKTSLSDKVPSKLVLENAGLHTLNEMVASQTALMVWKSYKAKDPLSLLIACILLYHLAYKQ